ncbi:ubiquitin domain-containing protein/Bromodomain domain-containing protein/TBP-binding domain-containing protein/DUF3591 domain-containing protein [Cephalotus follicularis]|uniref:Transcription initiation factor TFIID subunit 1 n=1 Tax=Cephalotus follicularis TaxID=3775 RepID=A0A1Q3BGK3_CEPFO|nr:ubiquitin domain-containing protein/Bromodomain domain-containing protein/TBP-binding domain-containing protein/DUF3591 domain-containing protein [Cephalotus follicularis]
MGYEPEMTSADGNEEDDEEEYEETGGGNRFLGFMFGNVDNSGDLDVDYLDEDAKEHLAALADKLGSSLTDIDLSVKLPQMLGDAAEQDYGEKAEDAVDYEDIDEQYEGPETQAATEEDYLLPMKEYYSAEVVVTTMEPKVSVFDNENYDEDEDEEFEKVHEVMDKKIEVQTSSLSGEQSEYVEEVRNGEKSPENSLPLGSLQTENLVVGIEDLQEDVTDDTKGPLDGLRSTPLPVLCIEDGLVILRFSEIFGIHEPHKKVEKRDRRYSTYRDKYNSTDVSHIVEEDEEAFLKGSGSFWKPDYVIQHETSIPNVNGSEVIEFGVMHGDATLSAQHEERFKDSCLSAEPMKDDLMVDLSAGWRSPLCPGLLPLDQQDWEDRILWDNSPSTSNYSDESCEISEPDSDALLFRKTETGLQNLHLEHSAELDEKEHDGLQHSSSVILESFGSRNSSRTADIPFSESKCHPQLLRFETWLNEDNFNGADGAKENVSVEPRRNDSLRSFRTLTPQNRDMIEGSWLDNITWEPHKATAKPKLILDLQDEQMLFEILDNKDGKHLRLHAGAMIITRSVKPGSAESFERQGHKYKSGWQFNIANDKFYMNGKLSQRLQSNTNKRLTHGIRVHHSAPALKLQTMKLKLSNKDISNFHRPKSLWYPHDNAVAVKEQGKLPTQGPMKIIIKSLGGKGTKLHVDIEETVSSVKAKASKKLDFKPSETVKIFYLGRELEDHKSLATQNVQPNSLLHLVRTKVHLLPRAQKLPGENKALRPPGAFKKKSDLSVKDGHVFLMEYCEERPLLLSNAGMGANLCTYYQKSAPGDQAGNLLRNGNYSLGNVLILEPGDKSPFLGYIKAGCSQSSIETNMYKAPIFSHKVPSTDYLLVRSAKGKLSIRRIDKIAVVGQQEPLMEVMSPGSKNFTTYILNRLLVHVYREFSAATKRSLLPCIAADELSTQFPYLTEAIIRKKMKECAFLRKDGQYSMKRDFHIPSESDLRKMVPPEHVCANESMQAALYRLKHLGITRLTIPAGISSAMSQLPDEAIALAAASHIERELQITPWNLSSNFVACTNQDRGNIERLEITGVGDPSGRGLGFSYVRVAPKAPVSNAMVRKKTAAVRGGSTVTGTDADLRRLSMEAAREVLLKFNVPDEVIAKQTRWHRIAMIRKLSSEQAASGVKVDPTTISKYARGQRMSYLQLQQQTREKCQEIWDRQVQYLSSIDGDDNESDSEANSDLDSFAGDLENLLDAEEFEEGEEGNCESKHEKAEGVKGIKMRRRPSQAQAEEEIEDEAAEAAELCRLLMDGDDAEQKSKKKKKSRFAEEAGFASGSCLSFGNETLELVKKTTTPGKQINGMSQLNVLPINGNSIGDSKEVENLSLKRKKTGNVKAKKNGVPPMGQLNTKVKILGDSVKKIFKEKKSSRESFVCGACGQFGHMRTNKNCPKYREGPDTQPDSVDLEIASAKLNSLEPSNQTQLKTLKKRLIPKSATAVALIEATEAETYSTKSKVLPPVKFKCGSADKVSDKVGIGAVQISDQAITSIVETGNHSVSVVNRIIISSKIKPEEVRIESHKPSIVIRPPTDADRGQVESQKPSIVIRPPANRDRDQLNSHKPSIVIRPPSDKGREQQPKKITIKRPKEVIDLDLVSQDGNTREYRKTKKLVELSSFEQLGKHDSLRWSAETSNKKAREEKRWWEEEEKRRNAVGLKEEKAGRVYEEGMRVEQEKFAGIRRYQGTIRREMDEEFQKANKQKKKKKLEINNEYLEDYRARRNDRSIPARNRNAKRPVVSGRYGTESAPPTKRRRGGEVVLSNILESIVETLKESDEISYLFLKPVSKKEAPDYLKIVKHPMDLSTIREKVRNMEYKNREDFRHDVWQISFNAHQYNDGRNPGIPPLADQLVEICDFLLEEYRERLTEAEEGIDKEAIL